MINPDSYYQRSEVSNSDLTALKELLHPRVAYGDREAAFRFGSIVDAIITEPQRVDFLKMTIDGAPVDEEEFLHAREMQRALRAESREIRSLQRSWNLPTLRNSWSTKVRFLPTEDLSLLLTLVASGIGGCRCGMQEVI